MPSRKSPASWKLPRRALLATIDFPPVAERPGTQIGPYKLLEQIGEGGMGIVYVASQKEPIRRKVALKIIKPGMDTREVVTRFEAERQAHLAKTSEWLKGYEQRCEEALKQGTVKYPLPVQLKRLQAEAAAMLGVTLPTVEPAPEPAAKVEEAKELPKSTPAPEPAKEEEASHK